MTRKSARRMSDWTPSTPSRRIVNCWTAKRRRTTQSQGSSPARSKRASVPWLRRSLKKLRPVYQDWSGAAPARAMVASAVRAMRTVNMRAENSRVMGGSLRRKCDFAGTVATRLSQISRGARLSLHGKLVHRASIHSSARTGRERRAANHARRPRSARATARIAPGHLLHIRPHTSAGSRR